ncbi:hypothetical protein AZJ33_00455 [Streptococcus pneumoniae]|uniref:Uncharacterized protein n=6 Tax=Streptococcus pneumoniae TaxID=1313 RepID=A0A559CPX5_STREE|nr:hypothetical protein AZK39_03780 [Streptococcus pneumoniae]TVV62034.1 hypothetical protein AZK32_01185 [Streptococcus pneumoniae]TVV62771.1 hypothetical protein AZK33_07345 [Streptococcus pneumoniae]TVV64030.1 hypothetical protein AZK34_03700 [Streptococcus pneumoniae]TVV67455.1 hypothetical protein AZK31_01010 [Streptococcus pneumoniae]
MFLHHFTEIYDTFAPFLPLLSKQKNRKPEPAVKEQFRKFPFYLFNCNQAIWLYCELWLVCQCSVWFEVVPACSVC